jgi:hypothetical protein
MRGIQKYKWAVKPVLPLTRTEAATDNSQAADRVLSMNIWTTDWYPGPNTYPYFKISGDLRTCDIRQ